MAGDPRPDDRPLEDRADGAAFEELLGSLNADLADVPEDVIERARRSGDELYSRGDQGIDQESGGAGRHERESSGQAIRVQVDASSENPRGNGRMILAARAVICVSAAVIAGVAVFLNSAGPVRGETTLGHVLDDAAAADSLHLKVIRGDSQADVLVAKSGRLRWEEHPTRYQIARGSTLWRIDESTNTATEEANPWFTKETDEELGIDLLSLLQVDELGDESIARLRKAGASRRLPYEGQLCDVFQLRTTAGSRKLIIEAYVNADSQQLRSIICRPYPPTDPDVPPIAEVRLLARDIPIDESKFKIASSLSEDGRIGKIVDSQGIVTLRTVMRRRWTPVARQTLLKPGDWLRTDLRGANASTVHLTSKFRVIAGPGTLLELQKPDQLLLHTGEVHITGSGKADESLTLHGPEGQKIAVKPGESVHYRVVPIGRLFKVKKKPKWLAGYDGSSNRESIGSLVANIDGRSMPLTVGFHKVKVEIRDQIARTTIEESFVNHTTRRLEGVFHFPLPQDASISGFGMWINGELIEADVVEKQRAREIYETILREKRDPGLLEWTGGNIFKARVFPIEPSAEKRIRIVYTQVLPLRANQYRYSYALRSEMLQKTPLRELSLNVLVHSALPLKSVDCPTHSVRTQSTRLSAQLEFAAQEYTPNRDFEVVCEVDAKQADVVMIPHRRGDDGYFLVQLSPPGREGNWQREILPDGNPLELLLVCDTSASMNSQNREQQQQFVASVLASLDEGDRFNVAVCDVDCHWLDDGWLVPGEGSSNRVRGWLDNRLSLGWTDLDRMTESVLEQVGAKTQVIYIGDGIVTAHDADPQGFVNRLRRLVADNSKPNASPPTFHTVSIGNSFESAVLKGLAETGGGSARQISGEQTPQRIALELLNEIAQPGLRDVRVEFRGIQAAAVYPERLPNLAAGTQQILVGRYLPQEGDHKGEIIVRGRRGGEDVQFSAPVSFKEAEQGNSFIPRLWARSQLDSLLEQGSSEFTKNAIIALSEEFHIITPYTSLLVLETDEDRERFGVKRRYQMRDGEQFFADGSEAARLKLKQQQMKRAGDWRIGLRRRVLYELSQLGRSTPQIQQVENELKRMSGYEALNSPFPNTASATQPVFTDGFSGGSDLYAFSSAIDSPRSAGSSGGEVNPVWALDAEFDMNGEGFKLARESDKFAEISDLSGKSSLLFDRQEMLVGLQSSPGSLETDASNGLFDFRKLASSRNQPIFGKRLSGERSRRIGGMGGNWSGYFNRGNLSNNQYTWWTSTLLPEIPEPTPETKPPESDWPAEAIEISKRLVKPVQIEAGGVQVELETTSFDPRWDRTTAQSGTLQLYSSDRWLMLPRNAAGRTIVSWCDGEQRGVFSRAFQLGRVRKVKPRDLLSISVGRRMHADTPMHITQRLYDVKIEQPTDDRVVLVLTYPDSEPISQTRLTIDTERDIIVRTELRLDDEVQSSSIFSDFVQLAGVWWFRKIESFDGKGRLTSRTNQKLKVLDEQQFERRFAAEKPDEESGRLVQMPLPTMRRARIAEKNGEAGFEHRLVLLLRTMMIQKWTEAFKQLEELEQLAADQPGLAWIRGAVLAAARRNEEARQLVLGQTDRLVTGGINDEFFLAGYVLDQLSGFGDQNEVLRLQDRLKPLFDRQAELVLGPRRWQARRATTLRALGRIDEVLVMQQELAASAPWDIGAQTLYATDLSSSGDHNAAFAWLRVALDRDIEWRPYEKDQLRNQYVQMLRTLGRAAALVEHFEEWIAEKPANQYTYQQYLSALIFADRIDEANDTALRWLTESRIEGRLTPDGLSRLQAAINFALGNRYSIYLNWIDPVWLKPLEETAKYFLQHEHHFDAIQQIVNHYRFSDSDGNDRVLAEVARLLKASADELHPRFVRPYVDWVVNREDLPKGEWLRIGAALRKRWDGMEKSLDRISLGEALLRIYQKHSRDEHHLPFLRRQIERATEDEEPIYAAEWSVRLFEELLSRKWRDEHEAEAFQLLGQLSAAELTSERLAVQIAALHRLVDSMLQSRFEADVEQFQDQDHPEKLSRTEFAKKRVGYRKKASEGLVARLNQLLKIEPDAPREAAKAEEVAELHDWMRMERAWLDVRLDRNLKRVEQRCWTILGDAPSGPLKEDDGEADIDRQNRRVLRDALQNRAFVTVSYLAARRSARAKLVSRVLKYVDAGTKLNSDAAIPWKRFRFSLLVALDQPKELEQNLRQWIREDEFPAGWQLALARLQAERGLIDEAITLFETVERDAELSPADYTVLADWYLVSDKPERRRRARIEVFKSTEEWQISNWIRQKQHPWTRRDVPLPTELDENVLFAFQALFEKSNTPQSYVYQLREFYTASRDFRLLQMVADSIVGRTPQQVYPFLRSLSASLLNEVRNEATADKTLERLREVREKAESATDLRALDLLECLIERRAATVQNQPGPHVEAAVAALKRAFQREWADGEVRQMAEFLDSLNTISRPTLAEERLRQLRELHGMTKPDTDDGVTVAWHLAHALYWSHDRQQEALALMEIAVREFERARPNGWPAQVNTPLDGYADLLEASRRFASAEKLLNRMLENPANAQQRDWLWQRRNQLYANALAKDGQVSLGQRDELYRNLLKHLRQQTEGGSDAHRRQVVNQVRAVFRTAKRKEISGHKNDLRTFAFEHLPPILRQQTNNYQNLISDTGTLIKDVIDTRTALEFLIARFEDYPTRFEYSYQNPWQQFGYQMNQWFKESRGDARKLEPRLLALVLKELRRDLSSRRQQSRYFFHKNYGTFFWEEKIPDFRRVAEEVLKERSDSGRSVYHIAQYLYGGLRHSNRAIEIMLIAHQKKLLSPQMQYDLCEWLHGQRRYGEAIAILEPLVERYPDSMRHRVLLLKSYAKTSRRQQMNTLLAETDEHFRQQGRWTQQNIRQLADGCLDIQLFKEAVQYYGEGISLVERSHPTRGIGTALLSDLYVGLARSYSGRGMTKEAVKAASDAIVAWGPNAAQRSSTISWLNTVLSRAKDLDDYVKHLDAETEKNGTDSPLIRKGVGLAYLDRDQPKKAIPQFRAALQLQPNDTQTHDRLIFAYDNIGDKDAGLKQTLAWLELDRHNLEGYRSLAQRLKTNERPPELTERALTTIVEAAPNEAEHHQLLAEFREQQDQWPAAIEHWKQVARLRSLEPRGLLELAEAQIHEEQWKEAQKSIDELNRKEWPARFTEVRSRVLRMQQRIPKSK